MGLNRKDKERIVDNLHKRFKEAGSVFVTDYRGLKVAQMDELRRRLRENSIDYMVVKNTFARLAAKDTRLDVLSEFFEGPVALVLAHNKDSVSAAKTLTDFSKEQSNLKLKTGFLENKVLSIEEIEALSLLPNKEVLLGMLVGVLKANLSALVNVLHGVPRGLVFVLKAVEEKKKGD